MSPYSHALFLGAVILMSVCPRALNHDREVNVSGSVSSLENFVNRDVMVFGRGSDAQFAYKSGDVGCTRVVRGLVDQTTNYSERNCCGRRNCMKLLRIRDHLTEKNLGRHLFTGNLGHATLILGKHNVLRNPVAFRQSPVLSASDLWSRAFAKDKDVRNKVYALRGCLTEVLVSRRKAEPSHGTTLTTFGKTVADVDQLQPCPRRGNQSGVSRIGLPAGLNDSFSSVSHRSPSQDGTGTRADSSQPGYNNGSPPKAAFLVVMFSLFSVPAIVRGWRYGPTWLFPFGWTVIVLSAAYLLSWTLLRFAS